MNTIWTLGDYASEKQVEVPGTEKNYTVRFATMEAMIFAARELVRLYEQWELQHVAYADVKRDAFLFDSKTGKMTFQDDKKVIGRGLELSEEQRIGYYSAPELILGDVTTMDSQTQNWTLAMLLFDLFYHGGHPLSGAISFTQIFFDPLDEYRWYAKNGIFNMEEFTCKNRPIYGIQGHLLRYWEYYPEVLQNAFIEVFLYGKEERERRLSPKQWKNVLNEMRSALPCNCGYSGFINTYRKAENGNYSCPRCGKIYYALVCGQRHIYISNGTRLYRYQLEPDRPDDMETVAVVVENKHRKGVFGVKNMTDDVWRVVFPDQTQREVTKNQGAPIWPGLSITLPNDEVWSIKQQGMETNNG